jgi:hypothetical protein
MNAVSVLLIISGMLMACGVLALIGIERSLRP